MKALLLFLLGASLQDEAATRLYDQTRFEPPVTEEDEGRRVLAILLNREHWLGAFQAIAEKFGPFPESLVVSVDFDLDGEELARAAGKGDRGKVSFNLKKLTEGQKKHEAMEQKKREVEAKGGRFAYRIPPVRVERIIYHELTHVLQAGCKGPSWFLEGMAQLIGDDPNSMCGFAVNGRKVRDIDEPLTERNDIYARGHLFWKWLDAQGAAQKVAQLCLSQHFPWKAAVEEATGLAWSAILTQERDWSAKEIDRLR